uniref:7TM GPCR serpentine receptor class x (Srx) domain-containing protein n=1 Tax=Panagrolaimus sp. PS1159 TaxID=55785 RepID=A0AC35FKE2_9BILA
MLLMAFTAINRWIVVVKPPYLPVFTRRHTIFFIIFAYSAGIFITILATYVLPCCMLYFEYVTMSFAYFVDGPNDTDHFLDYPVNVTCMTVAVLCYIRIRKKLFKFGPKGHSSHNPQGVGPQIAVIG